MKRILSSLFTLAMLTPLFACGGSSEDVYDGKFTINGVTYHCTDREAGDLCERGNCSKCDKI